MTNLESVDKQIADISKRLATETDENERDELKERMLYLQHKRIDVSAREYAADVRDDYRFRQW
jgi:hypothetical protein